MLSMSENSPSFSREPVGEAVSVYLSDEWRQCVPEALLACLLGFIWAGKYESRVEVSLCVTEKWRRQSLPKTARNLVDGDERAC